MKKLLFLLSIVFMSHSVFSQSMIGKPAPAWDIEHWIDANGKETNVKLDDYKGKVLYILAFQSWCPGCHSKGFPTLKYVKDKFKNESDLEFLVVQTVFEGHRSNTKSKLKSTQKKYDLDIPFGHDPGTKSSYPDIMTKYKTGGTPWVIIIDKDGTVKFSHFHIEPKQANELLKELLKI